MGLTPKVSRDRSAFSYSSPIEKRLLTSSLANIFIYSSSSSSESVRRIRCFCSVSYS